MVVYHTWFLNLEILTSGDWIFFFEETMSSLRLYYFTLWLGDASFGRVIFDVSQAPTYALYGILSNYFGLSYALSERLIHFWPAVILSPISSYFLLNKLFKNKVAVVTGILIYSFNTYFLILQTGTLTLMAAFALFPLVIFFYIESLDREKLVYILLTALSLFIIISYETRAGYVMGIILSMYFIYYLLFINNKKQLRHLIHKLTVGLIPAIIAFLLSFYWIMGLSHSGPLTNSGFFHGGLFGDGFSNILYSITLYQSFWSGSLPAVFNPQQIPIYYWLIPIVAFLGFYLNRKNKIVIFFGLLALLGILLTKQSGAPFPGLYSWLYFHLPGFDAFREASKFYSLIALGYSVLITGFVAWLWKNWKKTGMSVYGKYLLTIVIIAIFLWTTKPLITGEIGTLFVTRTIPKDYIVNKDFINKQSDYFRTLWIPKVSKWTFFTNIHPEMSLIDVVNIDWKDLSKSFLSNNKPTETQRTLSFLNYKNTPNLFKLSSIRYVYVPIQDKANDDDFFVHYGEPRQYYINSLNNITWLKKINIGTKDLVVYENENFRPHLYITQEKETFRKEIPFEKVSYEFVHPTQYSVSLKNVKESFYLNFSESFHPDWTVYVGDFAWSKVLTVSEHKDSMFQIPDSNHFKNDATLNSFHLSPISICKQITCEQNSDGSYDIEATVYFKPQSYLYLGGIISLITLLTVAGYLSYYAVVIIKKRINE